MIDKSIRQHYEIQGGKRRRFLHGSQGAAASTGRTSSPSTSGGGGGEGWQTYAISTPAPVVTTAVAPPSILSRPTPTVTTAPITRDVIPVAPTITKRPTEMLDIAGDIEAQQKLQEDIQESQRTGAYAKELGLPSIKRDVIPSPIINPFEETEKAGKLVDLTDLRDDAKTQHLRDISTEATKTWNKKTTREKEEQQERWDTAQAKFKSTKEGGFWKTLGNVALAILAPALLPAKLASVYKIGNMAYSASKYAKKLGLTKYDLPELLKDKNVIAEGIAKMTGKTDTSDDLSDIEEQMAFAPGSKKDKKLKALHGERQGVLELQNQGLDITFDPKKEKEYQELLKEDKEQTTEPKTILTAAHGGRIDSPLTGRSRYI